MSPSPGLPDSAEPSRGRQTPSVVEASVGLVLRYFDMWNTGQGAVADQLLAPSYVEHAHPDFLGPAALRSLVPRIYAMFPGVVVRVEIVASDPEYVAVRTRVDPGDTDGHPSAPRSGVALFRVADGKLAEQWSWYAPVRGGVPV